MSVRKFTAKVSFNEGDNKPKDSEMISFVLNMGLSANEISAVYQDFVERC